MNFLVLVDIPFGEFASILIISPQSIQKAGWYGHTNLLFLKGEFANLVI
jgi:hypothetical protein